MSLCTGKWQYGIHHTRGYLLRLSDRTYIRIHMYVSVLTSHCRESCPKPQIDGYARLMRPHPLPVRFPSPHYRLPKGKANFEIPHVNYLLLFLLLYNIARLLSIVNTYIITIFHVFVSHFNIFLFIIDFILGLYSANWCLHIKSPAPMFSL